MASLLTATCAVQMEMAVLIYDLSVEFLFFHVIVAVVPIFLTFSYVTVGDVLKLKRPASTEYDINYTVKTFILL